MKGYGPVLILLFGSIHLSVQDTDTARCSNRMTEMTARSLLMDKYSVQGDCYNAISKQIHQELTASITYLTMGAYFSRAEYYRPNVAKFFLDSASEERDHAKKMIDYMLKRGGDIDSTGNEMKALKPVGNKVVWESVTDAFKDALALEQEVTKSITNIISACESQKYDDGKQINDYHTADHFTSDFLAEQHDGTRKLAGFIASLHNMEEHHGALAEIIFDTKFAVPPQ